MKRLTITEMLNNSNEFEAVDDYVQSILNDERDNDYKYCVLAGSLQAMFALALCEANKFKRMYEEERDKNDNINNLLNRDQ